MIQNTPTLRTLLETITYCIHVTVTPEARFVAKPAGSTRKPASKQLLCSGANEVWKCTVWGLQELQTRVPTATTQLNTTTHTQRNTANTRWRWWRMRQNACARHLTVRAWFCFQQKTNSAVGNVDQHLLCKDKVQEETGAQLTTTQAACMHRDSHIFGDNNSNKGSTSSYS